jgi:tripartite-type tricarboxylate transporter receptor subunit TctC
VRPVRIVVGFPPGSTADIIARLLGQSLSSRLGQPFVIENRPGASGNLATESVVRAAPDGYTLLFVTSPNAVNATFYENLSFNFLRDIVPVAGVGRGPLVLLASSSLPARTIPEFIAYARTPGVKISMASSGTGTITHVAGELFKLAAEIPMLHVPYRGEAPAITDMIAGQVQVMFANLPPALEHVRAGRLHALAVTTAQRSPVLPEVSAMTEYLPGYEASGWQGLGAPVGTEDPIVQQLSREVQSALGENAMHDRLAALGVDPLLLPKNEFDRFVTAETEKWAKVVRSARIKPD